MKRITNISELKPDDDLVQITSDGDVKFWRFFMIHPKNEHYVLLWNTSTMNAEKFYIDNIISFPWYTGCCQRDINTLLAEHHRKLYEKYLAWSKEE